MVSGPFLLEGGTNLNIRRFLTNFALGLSCTAIVFSLSGCASISWEDLDAVLDNPRNVIVEVGNRNIRIIDDYRGMGLISESQADQFKKSIQTRIDGILNSPKEFADAVKGSMVAYDENSDFAKKLGMVEINEITPIEIMDSGFYETMIENMNKRVYVLNPNLSAADFNNCVAVCQRALEEPDNENVINELTSVDHSYFIDSNRTLNQFSQEDLFKVSSPSSKTALGNTSPENAINRDLGIKGIICGKNGEQQTITHKVVLNIRIREFSKEFADFISANKCTENKYLIPEIKSKKGTEQEDSVYNKIFLMEYPVEVLQSIQVGNGEKSSETSENNKWTMNFEEDDFKINLASNQMFYNGRIVNRETSESDLLYHIGTSEKVVKDSKNNSTTVNQQSSFTFYSKEGSATDFEGSIEDIQIEGRVDEDNSDDPYIGQTIEKENIDTSLLAREGGRYIYELNGVKYYCLMGSKTATIILTDYLELLYFPNVVQNEPFIATGRRIKLTTLSGDANQPASAVVGVYVTKNGYPIIDETNTYSTVTIGDLVDYSSGQNYYEKTAEKLGISGLTNPADVQEELNKSLSERQDKIADIFEGNGGSSSGINGEGLIQDRDMLPYTAYFNWIRPQLKFASADGGEKPEIAGEDTGITSHAFYGLCISNNAYASHLYTNWVDVQGDGGDVGSLSWWNGWLTKHGFQYHIDIDALRSAMEEAFSVAVADKDNTVIFNLNTINNINKKFTEEVSEERTHTRSTVFVVLGAVLYGYGFILGLLWVIDTNLVNGPGLLTIATFGHFQAIADSSEVPFYTDKARTCVTLPQLCFIVLGIWVFATILIMVDVTAIWGWAWSLLQNIFQEIKKVAWNKIL